MLLDGRDFDGSSGLMSFNSEFPTDFSRTDLKTELSTFGNLFIFGFHNWDSCNTVISMT